ncbi:Kinesin-like protein NACK1 [Morella rubra]|uniref:Kinesin-like protein n=1 Tax=Morella rubra TaxID=262757 RepID=A0A6A1WH58_9ROSI|nr:Kinesin-like protein NACK1 [Morella rubra]
MGAIGGEELMKWEKMEGVSGREEKILVLVRLRPLSEKEFASNEVADWECINDTTILYRNTLREGSTFPNAYTFGEEILLEIFTLFTARPCPCLHLAYDVIYRVFRGDYTTRQVYDEGAKAIALSVVSGINSSIFAYGQTSSGKTYTMVGITEYTVSDIFDYVQRHEERAFVLKFSAIEIYNEAIRDLLSTDNTPLRLLDDPERGTIVEKVTEETLRDWSHLKELLSMCEAQRQIGETLLNERSSRSHQIIRLTVESSAREFLGKDNSTALAASVNFIDLAGSERASQALSTGARLKEGCHINRSLLTLGTVIRKLSKGRHGHINYRDSKLTRILQPCLGGNARTAIICTLSPARSHVEQTRNTLLFACCAKEVTTKAQVNVVLSDKALVKHLQKELARLESELRSPVPASSTCDYAALLRKKDLQIEKMEKEIKEVTKQRDLAESRIQDLLRMIGNEENSRQASFSDHKMQAGDMWDDDCSVSESSVADHNYQNEGVKRFNNPHYYDGDSRSNPEEHALSDDTSSPLSIGKKFVRSHFTQSQKEIAVGTAEDPDDYCKEVRCIEMEESSKNKNSASRALRTDANEGQLALNVSGDGDLTSQPMMLTPVRGDRDAMAAGTMSSGSLKLTRSWSCRANLMTENAEQMESTPPNGFERDFPGRPEGLQRKFPLLTYGANTTSLSRNDSESSIGSASMDELRAHSTEASGEVEITSIHSFVAGLKDMAKLDREKQLVDGQVQETGLMVDKFGKDVKDVGVDPMLPGLETPPEWPLEFERQQRMILELWQTCNVSLVHRTYFFLLFKGDPMDSIYMGVELRRLSFLKETFSHGNQTVENGRTLTLASRGSMKSLRRERETLSKLMQKRFAEEERKRLFQRWGIALTSKRRRAQLVGQLWSKTNDMNHVIESAAIVAKLIRFVEQGRALKEMFGLSFTPPRSTRRSYSWKNSRASFV